MILPNSIPHSLRCPFCEGKEAKLEWNFHPHPNGMKSEYLSYYCNNCKNGFTTTESDTISLGIYHNKKRKDTIIKKRKKVIKKII